MKGMAIHFNLKFCSSTRRPIRFKSRLRCQWSDFLWWRSLSPSPLAEDTAYFFRMTVTTRRAEVARLLSLDAEVSHWQAAVTQPECQWFAKKVPVSSDRARDVKLEIRFSNCTFSIVLLSYPFLLGLTGPFLLTYLFAWALMCLRKTYLRLDLLIFLYVLIN